MASYYGGLVKENAALEPGCPIIVHLGRDDPAIPAEEVRSAILSHHPNLPVHIYEGAGHGFNNEDPARFNPEAAALARSRTRDLFGV